MFDRWEADEPVEHRAVLGGGWSVEPHLVSSAAEVWGAPRVWSVALAEERKWPRGERGKQEQGEETADLDRQKALAFLRKDKSKSNGPARLNRLASHSFLVAVYNMLRLSTGQGLDAFFASGCIFLRGEW